MSSNMISFNASKSWIEPAAFLVIAALAGSHRCIRYFPGATKGGLLLAGAVGAGACTLHDYRYKGEEFKVLRKAAAIALSSLISIALTRSLKGRVSLSFVSHMRVYIVGGGIILLKNALEPGATKKTDSLLTPIEGSSNTIRIRAGRDISCSIFANTKGKRSTTGYVTLLDHVYATKNADGKDGLLMRQKDFFTLKNEVCHHYAFGRDYKEVDGSELGEYKFKEVQGELFMFVWKIPHDLKEIQSFVWNTSVPFENFSVGEYVILIDGYPTTPSFNYQSFIEDIQKFRWTKIRTDFTDRVTPSTHHLYVKKKQLVIPGISTANFFKDFGRPKEDEREKVIALLDALAELGVVAFLCNTNQHMVIFPYYKDKPLTPESLAELFSSDASFRKSFQESIEKAATAEDKSGKDMREMIAPWIEGFIRRFGTKAS